MDQRNEPSTSQDENNLCAFCKNIAKTRCTGCLKVYYCNKEHQKLDWKIHAKNCSVLKLVKDASGQQYYVATRNIKVGEVVYEEEPIVVGPVSRYSPSCLSCYIQLTKETAIPCKKCGWPLCRDCKTHGPECDYTSVCCNMRISITDFERVDETYEHVIIGRSMALKKANPSAYKKLLKLRVRTDNRPEYYEGIQIARQMLLPYMPEQNNDAASEILQNLPVLRYHRHMIKIKKGHAWAVYENIRYFKNDCTSNCTKIVNDIGRIAIRAVTPISKGENVTICHAKPLFHAMERRKSLDESLIDCECKRCKDPTEFGTMNNTVKCIEKDCDGYMLPPTFIMDKRDENVPDFVCDKCSAKVPQIKILNILAQLEKEREVALNPSCDISQFEKILEKQRNILHEGHGDIVDVKILLVSRISTLAGFQHISDQMLIQYIKYCKEIVENVKLLMPSETILQGSCLFEMLRMNCEYFRRNKHKNSPIQNQKFRQDFMKIATECNKLLSNEQLPYSKRKTEDILETKKLIVELIARCFHVTGS